MKESAHIPAAAGILKHHFGKTPADVEELQGGLNNLVFQAKVGKQDYVVRMSEDPAKLQTFIKERWAMGKAREKNVPTPEVLEVGTDPEGRAYMISKKVTGLVGTLASDKLEVLRQMGEIAAAINSIPTRGFGHVFGWSENRLSHNKTWADYLEKELHVWKRVELFEKEQVLNSETLKQLRKELKALFAWKGKPTLNHGDIRLKNVLLDEKGRICALLDWEDATSNLAPMWELSIALHDLNPDEKEGFLEGYGIKPAKLREIGRGIKTLNILNYFGFVTEALKAKDKQQIERLKLRLDGTLDLCSL